MSEGPKRAWRNPPSSLAEPWSLALFTASDEYCNPTVALILPGLGMFVLCYRPGPLRNIECFDPTTCTHQGDPDE